jgi:hypothetical protein
VLTIWDFNVLRFVVWAELSVALESYSLMAGQFFTQFPDKDLYVYVYRKTIKEAILRSAVLQSHFRFGIGVYWHTHVARGSRGEPTIWELRI